MFDPTLTDDQKALCETARRFAAEKIATALHQTRSLGVTVHDEIA